MKHPLFTFLFLLIIVVNIIVVDGETFVEPYSPQSGPTDSLGADRDVSFFELPLWIQIAEISGFLLAIFGAIKIWPFILGKVKAIIENKNRTVILDYIGNHPGCTISDLSKNTGVNRGTAKYHLCFLTIERKIVRQIDGKQSYLFTNSGTALEKKRVYGYIMNPSKQEILKMIFDNPGISNKEIAERLQLEQSTVHWHIHQFLNERMVMSKWDGRSVNYYLCPDVEEILKEQWK